MALRTVEEYRQGLRDGRRVYIMGRPVEDVTEDPYIKVGVETGAFDYQAAHDPAFKDMVVIQDPETGEGVSRYFEVPDFPEAVSRRFDLVRTMAQENDTALPFIKDVGTDLINGLTAVANLMGNEDYKKRIHQYRWHCARNDLSMSGAVTDVKGDRSRTPSEQDRPDYYLRIVDETPDEIVVSGTKAHITAGAYTDEIIVIPTRNLNENEAEFAVAFAVPVNTPGITQICRPGFRYEDRYHFPTPNPKRGHVESLVVFNQVRIPKERVFLQGEWQFAQAVAYAFAAFHRFTAVTYKIPILEYMTGLGMLAADANGITKASHVRERFINMIQYTETTKGLARAAVTNPENFMGSGLYVADRLYSNMAKLYFASNFHEFIRDLQDLAGGLVVTQPTYQDWQNQDIRPFLECSLGGANGYNAEERLKLMSSLHHMLAGDFAGWHEVCTVHAEGSFAAQKMILYQEAPSDMYRERARKIVGLNV